MWLELFVWAWINLHPEHVKRRALLFLGLGALILMPLFIINMQMSTRGFKPSLPSFSIEAGNQAEDSAHYFEEDSL
ncbi:MAG: hypothetical protein ACR2HF_04355 [Methylococcaceae bacterium]